MNQNLTSSAKEQNNCKLKLLLDTSSRYENEKPDCLQLDMCSTNAKTEEHATEELENRTNGGTSDLKVKTATWVPVELTNASEESNVIQGSNGTDEILGDSKLCLSMIPIKLNSIKKRERVNAKLPNRNMLRTQSKSTPEKPNIPIKSGEKCVDKKYSEKEQGKDCIANRNDGEVGAKVSFKLKDNKTNLIKKYLEIKRKLNREEENISSDDMYKNVPKLKMESPNIRQSPKDAKLNRCSRKMVHDTSRFSDEQLISTHLPESAEQKVGIRSSKCKCDKGHCDCFAKELCHENKNLRREYRFFTNKNECFPHHEIKNSSKSISNAEVRSTHVDQGNNSCRVIRPKQRFSNSPEKNEMRLKMKNKEEMSGKQNAEQKRILALFNRQKDLIKKHVLRGSNIVKPVANSSNAYRAVQCNKRKNNDGKIPFEKFEWEIHTLEDMELFLSFLRKRKKEASHQNASPRKRAKTTRHKHVSKMEEKYTKERQLQYSGIHEKNKGTKKLRKAMDGISTKNHKISNDYEEKMYAVGSTSNSRESVKSSYEAELKCANQTEEKKFNGEICTLEEMESFLSFLRERKEITLNAGNNQKVATTIRSADNCNEEHSGNMHQEHTLMHSNQENEHGRIKTVNSLVNVYKTSTLDQNQTENITITEIQESIQPKRNLSNEEILKPSGRSLNSVNSKKEELSSENVEEFFQQHKGRRVGKIEKVEGIRILRLNDEAEDSLRLSRQRIKVKSVSCSTIRSAKISKTSKDFKKPKCGANDDGFCMEQYKKALQAIMAETRAIIEA